MIGSNIASPQVAAGNEANVFTLGSGDDDKGRRPGQWYNHWIDWLIIALVIGVAFLGYLFFRPR